MAFLSMIRYVQIIRTKYDTQKKKETTESNQQTSFAF